MQANEKQDSTARISGRPKTGLQSEIFRQANNVTAELQFQAIALLKWDERPKTSPQEPCNRKPNTTAELGRQTT